MIDVDKLLNGDRRTLAKSITLIESQKASDFILAKQLIEKIQPYTGKSKRIGISGVPGVGKSTFIDSFGSYLCDSYNAKVAVLAIDPSSPISGGSLLGDKTRMENLLQKQNSFIRPTPTSGTLGGIAAKTKEVMLLCEASGFDWIFIETVGVGQSEYKVADIVDFFTLLILPNAGDELQGIKKGILEVSNAIFINKCDGSFTETSQTSFSQMKSALNLYNHKEFDFWTTEVIKGSAIEKKGFQELYNTYVKFFQLAEQSGYLLKKRNNQNIAWFKNLVLEGLLIKLMKDKNFEDCYNESISKINTKGSSSLREAQYVLDKLKFEIKQ